MRLRVWFALLLVSAGEVVAAYKVRYRTYDWRVLRTAHFDIHHAVGSVVMAERAAEILENAHARIADALRFELTHTVPVFLYDSPNDFIDTDLTFEVLPSGVAGFTEVFKNRIAVPFPGSYADFRHVLAHELVHAFQFNILYGDFWESLFMRPFLYSPPLWFMEGMAEALSHGGLDAETDVLLREAVLSGQMPTLRELDDLGRLPPQKYVFVYKGGQSFLLWLEETYGPGRMGELLKSFRQTRDMAKSFELVVGRRLEELDREWTLYLRKRYWPDVRTVELWDRRFGSVTRSYEDGSLRNAKPVWLPDGRRIAHFTDASGLPEIAVTDLTGTEPRRTLVRGGLSAAFEELNVAENRLTVTADGRLMAFVSRQGASDRIRLYDLRRRRVVRSFDPRMERVLSAAVSPDGSAVAFSANRGGRNDLYVLECRDGGIRRVTDDDAVDLAPFWGADGWIYFASGRGYGLYSALTGIWRIRPDGGGLERLVAEGSSPALSPDGRRLAFVSRRTGTPNVFVLDLSNRSVRQVTDVPGGATDPAWSADGGRLAFVLDHRLGRDIVTASAGEEAPAERLRTPFADRTNRGPDRLAVPDQRVEGGRLRPVSRRLTPDWLNFALAFSDAYGFAGFGQTLLSDITGSHQVSLDFSFMTGTGDLNFDFDYLYQRWRLNTGFGLFRLRNYFLAWDMDDLDVELVYRQRTGGYLLLLYPLDRFTRLWANVGLVRYEQEATPTEPAVRADVVGPSVGLEFDNSFWNGTYRTRGRRGGVVYEYAVPGWPGTWGYHRLQAELRQYVTLGRRVTMAFQGVAGGVWGPDAARVPFVLGGINSVRGYPYEVFRGENMALLRSEYRFPFIDLLRMAWPLPVDVREISGVLFWDFGAVWDRADRTRFVYVTEDRRVVFDNLKSGLGFGLRMNLFYFRLIFDYATPFDGQDILPLSRWRGHVRLGYEF